MARPKQDGLLYFPFDTDFFYADKRIKRLHSRFGNDGMLFYIYLLTEIYRNGYYIRWDAESMDDAMDDLHITEGFIDQVMTFLFSRSLLTKRTLADPDTILPIQKEGADRPHCELADGGNGLKRVTVITSPGIQKRYQEAVKSRKRDVYVDPEIWLLNENETATYIKVIQKQNKSCGNESKSCGNESKSCGNDIKKRKVKESKEKKDRGCLCRIEEFISVYPKSCNRHLTETAYARLVMDATESEDNLVAAAKNYAEACRILKVTEQYIKNAENFLKYFAFEEYLPGKYQKPKSKKGGSNDFKQNEYDFEQLEKELLDN